ncbi:MAG: BatA domain-containing protein, partial [Planctomycetaceae bacterium]|nr:BatA domain-containing protein [Planctomycetaceae bacterium]
MEFVQSTFLYALAGLAVPVIIHLIFRWQTRRVDLGTTRFLAELLRETARRRKVKRWLLLALRMACVALLALLFARPYLLAQRPGNEERLLVFLIDRSAGMALAPDGVRLVDAAVERVQQLVQEAGESSIVEAAFFDTSVEPILTDGREREAAFNGLKAPQQLWKGTSYGAAMSWARDICLKSSASARDVYVFTDLQRAGLDWTDAAPFPEGVRVRIEDLGRDVGNNVAMLRAVPAKTLLRPGQGTTISVTLFNFGEFSHSDTPVVLSLHNGARTVRLQDKASLRPGEATEVEFELGGVDTGLWEGTVAVDIEDDLRFDNVRHLALLSAPPQRCLIVDGSESEEGGIPETWFLERALRLAASGESSETSPFRTEVCRLESQSLPALDQFELVVLANAAQLSPTEAERLAKFVRAGGGLLVFTGENVTAEGCRSLAGAGLTPGEIRGIARTHDLPLRWERWDDRHLTLTPFNDPQNGDLTRLGFQAFTEVSPAPDTKVLAWFGDDEPALTEHRLGNGRVLWFLSSCSRAWGDWARSRLFLPLVHQLLGDLAQLTGGGPIQTRDIDEFTPALAAVMSDAAWNERLSKPGVTAIDQRWYVTNVNPRESDTDRCTPEEFADRFRFEWSDEAGRQGGLATATGPRGTETRRDEVWSWVACLLIGVLGLEWMLS